ncbi:MAG: hybrid sensor histidine kinase/response regulator [Planctomycetota bacterium]|nr:hybrid sensor histidine kinase/response regulator [Planctomycetota bacterium]
MNNMPEDVSLLELFREEVRTNVQSLNDGLIALEKDASDPTAIEPLMRAAHSIKGAARVVGVDSAVKLAHLLEECLVRAQDGKITLNADSIDVLLRGSDLLAGIGESVGPGLDDWLLARGSELEQLQGHLQLVADAKFSAEKPEKEPPRTAEPAAPPPDVPAPTTADPPPMDETHESPSNGAAIPTLNTAEAGQVVRVTAENLTRLMGLAGETLVEARWLQPFSKSLLQLKREQTILAETLEELRQLPGADEERREQLTDDALERLDECRRMVGERVGEFENRARRADDLNSRLYHEVIASRLRPLRDGIQGFPRMVRDLARQMGKKVSYEVSGEMTDVDRDILEKLEAPLNHILRNAVDHGLEPIDEREAAGKAETCLLRIEARHNAGMLVLTIADDGRGIDLEKIRRRVVERNLADGQMAGDFSDSELLDFLFLPGFSTSEQVTEVSGRGVGMDVVHTMVHSVGGKIRIQTEPGRGTTVRIELPITLSVIRAVLVTIAGEAYAFPHNRIDRLVRLPQEELSSLEHRQHFTLDGRNVGTVLASQVLDLQGGSESDDDLSVILFSNHSNQYGLVVGEFHGEHDLVVRPLDPRLGKVPNINAASILDDGSPVLIVDVDDLRSSIEKLLRSSRLRRTGEQTGDKHHARAKRILVVDDSITVREVQRQLLANEGYAVEVAVDGMEGFNSVRQGDFDLVITDIDMPRLNGIDLVSMIKKDSRLQAVPVVIVSYKDREEDRLRGLEAGANYYLTKSSFHDETLLGVVKELIGEAGT